jgi:hypothetical protein
MVEVVTVQTRWPDAVAAGEVGTYEQVMLPGFLDEHFLGTDEFIAQAQRIAPERAIDLGRRKRFALVAMRVVVDFCAFMGAMWLAFYLRFVNGYMAARFGAETAPEISAVFLTSPGGVPQSVRDVQGKCQGQDTGQAAQDRDCGERTSGHYHGAALPAQRAGVLQRIYRVLLVLLHTPYI